MKFINKIKRMFNPVYLYGIQKESDRFPVGKGYFIWFPKREAEKLVKQGVLKFISKDGTLNRSHYQELFEAVSNNPPSNYENKFILPDYTGMYIELE